MTQRWRQRLHPDVLKLGVVSFLTDVSSEMIFAVFATPVRRSVRPLTSKPRTDGKGGVSA